MQERAKTLFDSSAKRHMKSLTGRLECRPFRGKADHRQVSRVGDATWAP
jgi:hypothetical protein